MSNVLRDELKNGRISDLIEQRLAKPSHNLTSPNPTSLDLFAVLIYAFVKEGSAKFPTFAKK